MSCHDADDDPGDCREILRRLPRWRDAWSDGCSVPTALRPFFPYDNARARRACIDHDARYYYGGSARDRLYADARFLLDLLDAGVDMKVCEQMYTAVRMFGGPSARRKGVSWAFGGDVFAYTSEPAVPA